MSLKFLRKDPPAAGVNNIKFKKLDNTDIVAFHPFITSFTHTIQPKVEVSTYGAFQIPSYNRTGLATEEYSIGIDLPALDIAHAKKNYDNVRKLQAFVKPTLSEAQNQSGILKMFVNPLIEGEVIGFLTKVDATYEIEPGFEEGYPKLIRLSISFGVDKAYAELFSQQTSEQTSDGYPEPPSDQSASTTPPGSVGEAALQDGQRASLEVTAALQDGQQAPLEATQVTRVATQVTPVAALPPKERK